MTIKRWKRILNKVTHKEAALRSGLYQALRLQQVIGGHHGIGAHILLARTLAHRRQARARRQQPRAYAIGQALSQLLGQGQRCLARQGNGHGFKAADCIDANTNTEAIIVGLSVLEL